MNYEKEEIERKVNIAIGVLFENDAFLLESDVNERSITHKLAEYLQQQFPEYHVDCEYNRTKNKSMGKRYITKILELPIDDVKSDNIEAKTVYPDIIVHKRGTEINLLAIEIKKKTNNSSKGFDYKKLQAFKSQLKYTFALFVEFNNKNLSEFEFV